MLLSEKNDQELVAATLAGDGAAFAILVERYTSPVYKFSYRYVRNGADAEDIAQEAFLRAWKNLKSFDASKSFTTWLFTIAKNASLDLIKKKKPMLFSAIGDEDETIENALAPYIAEPSRQAELFDQAVLKENLDVALGKLPPHYRNVMVLRYRENLKFREIAETLHEPIDTVKSRHRRGLALLKGITLPEMGNA